MLCEGPASVGPSGWFEDAVRSRALSLGASVLLSSSCSCFFSAAWLCLLPVLSQQPVSPLGRKQERVLTVPL